ncbi:hypothetical protein [Geodermatophilus obscurus]|uniref:hypothetical protein n=1 Tax=Geodermatophilus obscurus TaxID=1861 RepID=UPI0015A5D6EB|nr:hypothetical protein [Geodermatophilus obscurus]
MAGMLAHRSPPDLDVPGRRQLGDRPVFVAEVTLVKAACATGQVAPVDRSGGLIVAMVAAKRSVRASHFVTVERLEEPG